MIESGDLQPEDERDVRAGAGKSHEPISPEADSSLDELRAPSLSSAAASKELSAEKLQALLSSSQVRREGTLVAPSLGSRVAVSRDERGFVKIEAESFSDSLLAQGFVHAQERFLQMDLSRRKMLGQLAELFGPDAVPSDEYYLRFELETVAKKVLSTLPEYERKLLEEYSEGVNQGLRDLEAPGEYLLMGTVPRNWSPEDSILCALAMSDDLNDGFEQELDRGKLKENLPAELYEFLHPKTSRFDGAQLTPPFARDYHPVQIPSEDAINLRNREELEDPSGSVKLRAARAGSNAWVVGGQRSKGDGAILANDPHLDLGNPGVFFQSQIELPDRRVCGLSIPGCPGITIGSNGKVAWGFTNLGADFRDLVRVRRDPKRSDHYLSEQGSQVFEDVERKIWVAGEEEPRRFRFQKTHFGPVIDDHESGDAISLRWTGLDSDKFNFSILRLQAAANVEEAIGIARGWFGPAQNFMVAGSDGRVGWTITGYLPRRRGIRGDVPEHWPNLQAWDGLAEELRPSRLGAPSETITTANNRTLPEEQAESLGNYFSLASRAVRIDRLLNRKDELDERDMLDIQLDTRVELFDYYKELALCVDGGLGEVSEILQAWDGRADENSRGLALLEEFRKEMHQEIIGPLIADAREKHPELQYFHRQGEEVLRRIMEEQPFHLLNSKFESYDELVTMALSNATNKLSELGLELDCEWGEYNQTQVQHVLSGFSPELAMLLNIDGLPLAGHPHAVRVAQPGFGAAARIVVSPGNEEQGILQLVGGQDGHLLSDSFRNEFGAWHRGEARPLLVSDVENSFELLPRESLKQEAEASEPSEAPEKTFLGSKLHRGLDLALRSARVFKPFCSVQEARMNLRRPESLPLHLRNRFSIPEYRKRSLEKIPVKGNIERYVGELEIDGRTLAFDCFLPREPEKPLPFVTVLPITEGGLALNQLVSMRLAKAGFASGTLLRAPDVFRVGKGFDEMEDDLRRSIREQRAFLSFVSGHKEIDTEALSALGISLGGIIASGLSAVEPRVKGSVIALAGSDFPALIRRTRFDLVQDWLSSLREREKGEMPEVHRRIDRVLLSDPRHLAQYVDPRRVTMISAHSDAIVPRFNSDSLWERLGRPERLFVPFGHYGCFLNLDWMVASAADFLRRRIE